MPASHPRKFFRRHTSLLTFTPASPRGELLHAFVSRVSHRCFIKPESLPLMETISASLHANRVACAPPRDAGDTDVILAKVILVFANLGMLQQVLATLWFRGYINNGAILGFSPRNPKVTSRKKCNKWKLQTKQRSSIIFSREFYFPSIYIYIRFRLSIFCCWKSTISDHEFKYPVRMKRNANDMYLQN